MARRAAEATSGSTRPHDVAPIQRVGMYTTPSDGSRFTNPNARVCLRKPHATGGYNQIDITPENSLRFLLDGVPFRADGPTEVE